MAHLEASERVDPRLLEVVAISRRAARSSGDVELALRGELSAFTAPGVIGDLLRRAPDDGRLRLDLGDVTFCDTAGVRLLTSLQERLDRRRTTVEIQPMSPAVFRLLALCGVDGRFAPRPIEPGASAAPLRRRANGTFSASRTPDRSTDASS